MATTRRPAVHQGRSPRETLRDGGLAWSRRIARTVGASKVLAADFTNSPQRGSTALWAKGFGVLIIEVCTPRAHRDGRAATPVPRSMFAGFPLDLGLAPESQLFVVPVQQRGLVQVLAERAGEYAADIRWGHVLTGFDQH